ncbi:MAG TPA: hypothetical protein VET90_01810 [Candidatus Binatus sp.]|nr:hypothetical protein [Candidatus Binatus sp.]
MPARTLLARLPESVKAPLRPVRAVCRNAARLGVDAVAATVAWLPHPPERQVDGLAQSRLSDSRKKLPTQRHFGPRDLDRLTALLREADAVVSVAEAFDRRSSRPERFVALRHDMDHDVENSVRMAEWEASAGLTSTYYVLHTDWYWGDQGPGRPSAFVLRALDRIASLGHEIGVHNNALAEALRTKRDPAEILEEVLTALRDHGFRIRGTASHGDPLAVRLNFRNYEMFEDCRRGDGVPQERTIEDVDEPLGRRSKLDIRPVPMARFDLEYEAYYIGHTLELSESGGRWSQPPDGVASLLRTNGAFLQILTHPVHWAFSGEVIHPIPTVLRHPDPTLHPS